MITSWALSCAMHIDLITFRGAQLGWRVQVADDAWGQAAVTSSTSPFLQKRSERTPTDISL